MMPLKKELNLNSFKKQDSLNFLNKAKNLKNQIRILSLQLNLVEQFQIKE